MNDYLLFMFDDAVDGERADDDARWEAYLATLRASGQFDGGSAIGRGERLRQGQVASEADLQRTGFIRVRAASLEDARRFLVGNPVYEAGGSIEIRELPKG